VDFNCVQRCQGIVTVVAIECGPMMSPRIRSRLRSLPREQQPRTSHLKADVVLLYRHVIFFWFHLHYVFKLEQFIIYVSLL
jgi:hypothetical protein